MTTTTAPVYYSESDFTLGLLVLQTHNNFSAEPNTLTFILDAKTGDLAAMPKGRKLSKKQVRTVTLTTEDLVDRIAKADSFDDPMWFAISLVMNRIDKPNNGFYLFAEDDDTTVVAPAPSSETIARAVGRG